MANLILNSVLLNLCFFVCFGWIDTLEPAQIYNLNSRRNLYISTNVLLNDCSVWFFDEASSDLYVGCQNTTVLLDTLDLRLSPRSQTSWVKSKQFFRICLMKFRNSYYCSDHPNAIFKRSNDTVTICSTNSNKPRCIDYSKDLSKNLTTMMDMQIPGNPKDMFSFMYLPEEKLFIAAYKKILAYNQEFKLNMKSVNRYLHNPQFVSSVQFDNFVYIFANEEENGKIHARVFRVCNNDSGTNVLPWLFSTLRKANVHCSFPFTMITDSFVLETKNGPLLYLLFQSENPLNGSAVCVYNRSDLSLAFDGPYAEESEYNFCTLEESENDESSIAHPFTCNATLTLKYRAKSIQMYNTIHSSRSLLKINGIKFSKFFVIETAQRAGSNSTLVYLVETERSTVYRYNVFDDGNTCLLSKTILPASNVRAINVFIEKGVYYILHSNGVIQMPLALCTEFVTEAYCSMAQDPLCGWDTQQNKCVADHEKDPSFYNQFIFQCPTKPPKHGGFSNWFPWEPCNLNIHDDSGDLGECLCRYRLCNSPIPENGGRECSGKYMEVKNCVINGGWSEWGEWNDCEEKVQHQERACNNPSPMNGGLRCVGSHFRTRKCKSNEWGEWGMCSSPCGFDAKQTRLMMMDDFSPTRVEERKCQPPVPNECPQLSSAWRLVVDKGTDGWIESREYSELKPNGFIVRSEQRTCKSSEDCFGSDYAIIRPNVTMWSSWTPCNATCGESYQRRRRECLNNNGCSGIGLKAMRMCDSSQPCAVESIENAASSGLSCWSDWTHCNCEENIRSRTRICKGQNCGKNILMREDYMCQCEDAVSNIESTPTEWSSCYSEIRTRKIPCAYDICTKGFLYDVQQCDGNDLEPIHNQVSGNKASSVYESVSLFFIILMLIVILTFVCLYLITNLKAGGHIKFDMFKCLRETEKQDPAITQRFIKTSRSTNDLHYPPQIGNSASRHAKYSRRFYTDYHNPRESLYSASMDTFKSDAPKGVEGSRDFQVEHSDEPNTSRYSTQYRESFMSDVGDCDL